MMNSNKYELLDKLFNLFLDAKLEPEDEELFKEWDIQIDSILQKHMPLFRQLRTHARAELNKMKHERVKAFLVKVREGIKSNKAAYLKIAEEIVAKPRFAELQTMFRNLSSVSEKDREAIVMDAKLLDLLSELEEQYNSKGDEN